jgi:hypothetical protein
MLRVRALHDGLARQARRLRAQAARLRYPAITLGLLLVLAIVFHRADNNNAIRLPDFPEGGVAPRDVVADRDLVYVDEVATQLKLEAAEKLTPPVFRVNDEITRLTVERYTQFETTFLEVFRKEGSLQKAFLQMQLVIPRSLTEEQIARLNSNPVVVEILRDSREILVDLMERGIVALPEGLRERGAGSTVDLWRWRSGRLERSEAPVARLVTGQSVGEHLDLAIRDVGLAGDSGELARVVVTAFARENVFPDAEETKRAVDRARSAVAPEMARLVKGQSILRKGDIVTDEAVSRIRAMGAHRVTVGANTILGAALLLLIGVCLAVYLLHEGRTGLTLSDRQVLFLCGSAVVYGFSAALFGRLVVQSTGLPFAVYLPTATLAILVALVISTHVAVGFTVSMAVLLLALVRLDLGAFLFALLSGIGGIAVVSQAKTRIDLIRAGLILSALDLPVLFSVGFLSNAQGAWFAAATAASVANGFLCGVLALGLLPILEHALNTATRFRLMELSDVNSPTLKRMLTLAPGTYSHSLAVANLAESACTEIGANHLLARVGAYYHDIGKIEQAEYFAENQTSENKHDDLQPSLSVAVIKSHVKMGVEKGKELSLPDEVVDIIAQHHGRDLIKYFYHRAKSGDDANHVSANDYSYRGTRPRTREAAVVMLADAVEATTRSLRRPSAAKLEKTVWDSIMERFTRGELSESTLTFRDLEVIKRSFVHVLAGHFHTRIEYPRIVETVR